MSVKVLNLLTGEEQLFSCDARTAVQSAYAAEHKMVTQFAVNQGTLPAAPILEGEYTIACGNWCAIK